MAKKQKEKKGFVGTNKEMEFSNKLANLIFSIRRLRRDYTKKYYGTGGAIDGQLEEIEYDLVDYREKFRRKKLRNMKRFIPSP